MWIVVSLFQQFFREKEFTVTSMYIYSVDVYTYVKSGVRSKNNGLTEFGAP